MSFPLREFAIIDPSSKIEQIKKDIRKHIEDESWIWIQKNKLEINISFDGDAGWPAEEFIVAILMKVHEGDPEIVKRCMDNGIPLFQFDKPNLNVKKKKP